MLFDFRLFADITASIYPDTPYNIQDALGIFRYYFEKYEAYSGMPHPPINARQIARICRIMPFFECPSAGLINRQTPDIEPEDYPAIIDRHFKTKYRHCDFNINHFFSGRIRELRFYEAVYTTR